MKRAALAVLIALIVPACNRNRDDDDHEVTVSNLGDEPAVVKITHERAEWFGGGHADTFLYDLAPGQQHVDLYPSTHEVKVYITRKSDGLLLYAANYGIDDFDNHDDRIWISVNP